MATNLGTLAAVLIYFRRDVAHMLLAGWQAVFSGRRDLEARLAWGIVLASLPVLIIGFVIGVTVGEKVLRLPWLIAVASIVFGLLLGVIDRRAPGDLGIESLRARDYLVIGLAQAVALIPGSSRSGMSMLGGRALRLDRRTAARVAFFMAIPVTAAAIAFELLKISQATHHYAWSTLGLAALFSWITAMLAIDVFMRLIQAVGMMPFVIYRVLLGAVILSVMAFGGW